MPIGTPGSGGPPGATRESDVPLNPGGGGSLVRTIQVPTALGLVEQQVIVEADKFGNLAAPVSNDEILAELKKISGALQLLLWDHNINIDPLEVSA